MLSTNEHDIAVPNDLGSADAKLVYVALVVAGEATVTELQDRLGLSKLTLLPILSALVSADYARRTEDGYATR